MDSLDVASIQSLHSQHLNTSCCVLRTMHVEISIDLRHGTWHHSCICSLRSETPKLRTNTRRRSSNVGCRGQIHLTVASQYCIAPTPQAKESGQLIRTPILST